MKPLCVASLLLLLISPSSRADLVLFDFGTGNVGGSVLTQTLTGQTIGGVTFDVTLTLAASDDIKITSQAVGVQSPGQNGQAAQRVDNAESLNSFLVSVANEVGGSIQFDGWAEATYQGVAGANSNSSGDAVVEGAVALTGSPISWSTTAGAGGEFKLESIRGNFSVAAVPEPSSFLLFGLLSLFGFRRRRPSNRSPVARHFLNGQSDQAGH